MQPHAPEVEIMQTCIQTSAVAKDRDYDKTVISLRLGSAEAVRYWRVMDDVKARNPYVGKSDVIRELLGLQKPTALKQSEIDFFRGKRSLPDPKPELTYDKTDPEC